MAWAKDYYGCKNRGKMKFHGKNKIMKQKKRFFFLWNVIKQQKNGVWMVSNITQIG